jgi:hypothetical protein
MNEDEDGGDQCQTNRGGWANEADYDDLLRTDEENFDSSDDEFYSSDDDSVLTPQAAIEMDQQEDTIFYEMQMRFPPELLVEIRRLRLDPNNNLDRRLNATKIGYSSSYAKFQRKIARYRTLLPFVELQYEYAVIPRQMIQIDTVNGIEEKEFNAFVVEQGIHFIYTPFHLDGEWYDITKPNGIR